MVFSKRTPSSAAIGEESSAKRSSSDHEHEDDEAGDGEIFENCIEKNFHVPK
jgi:hypothetical protein